MSDTPNKIRHRNAAEHHRSLANIYSKLHEANPKSGLINLSKETPLLPDHVNYKHLAEHHHAMATKHDRASGKY